MESISSPYSIHIAISICQGIVINYDSHGSRRSWKVSCFAILEEPEAIACQGRGQAIRAERTFFIISYAYRTVREARCIYRSQYFSTV